MESGNLKGPQRLDPANEGRRRETEQDGGATGALKGP